MSKGFVYALIVVGYLQGCASSPEVYRWQGLKSAVGPQATDGIFQDFQSDVDTVAGIWTDPDALSHKSQQMAQVRVNIAREEAIPYLNVSFTRAGYGTSVRIAPKAKVPERISANSNIVFDMRSKQAACVGLRVMDYDGEEWGYGDLPLDYSRLCINAKDRWESFVVPVDVNEWFKFSHGGNVDLGNNRFDHQVIAMLTFELGLSGKYYLSPGEAEIGIRNIRVKTAE